ncbi:MAG: Signal transduction histidine kinaselike protein [Streptosporangiaceae bacterium]|jgi:signal transduction histidine kinase|nr:Signal transduction histidine kinaselike protein [Streptosporangiaceae bacterium]
MTLLSGVVIGLLSLGFCGLILLGLHKHAMSERVDRVLLADLRVAHLIAHNKLPPVIHERTTAIQVVDGKGRIVAASEQMVGKPRMVNVARSGDGMRATWVTCSSPAFPHSCVIVVALDLAARQEIIFGAQPVVPWYVHPRLLITLLGGSGLLAAASAIGAYRTVGKALNPVDGVVHELAEITATDLGRRVPVPEHHDEMRGLAETVNQTLDRLEAAVEQQRRFASDASHDLRSPITAMRLQLEEAQLHPDETDWPKMAEAQEASLDRLEAIVTDLLALARLDSCATSAEERVDLGELVSYELGRRTARRRIETNLQPGVVIRGNRLQLSRLLTNLVDNAERHAACTVTVSVRRDGDEAVLEVQDDGPGIPPGQREVVFERFARLDTARNKETGGTGLGLPIARQIAAQHGGTLSIEDSEQGARFVVRIPLREPERLVTATAGSRLR